jgi:hypothetical protein
MMTPAWILGTFTALMLAVTAVSAARLAAARPWRRGAVVLDTEIAHLLMAIAMAGMLDGGLRTLPDGAWAAVFGVLTAWFGYRVASDATANGIRALARGHCAPHLVHSAAMLYMFLALAAPGADGAGMSGMAGPRLEYPTVALAFGLVLAGYSVWDLDLLSSGRYGLAASGPTLAGPALAGSALAGAPVIAMTKPGVMALPHAQAAGGGSAADAPSRPADPEPGPAAARRFLQSCRVTVGCRIAMGLTMAFMLFVMI